MQDYVLPQQKCVLTHQYSVFFKYHNLQTFENNFILSPSYLDINKQCSISTLTNMVFRWKKSKYWAMKIVHVISTAGPTLVCQRAIAMQAET